MSTKTPHQSVDLSRRFSLKAMSMLPFIGYGVASLIDDVRAATSTCTVAPTVTQGPYWVDEKLNRSDITTGTTRASVLNGLPLTLAIKCFNTSGGSCGIDPIPNLQIDIWHCDAAGEYSDASGNGQSSTVGQTFLRGYQMSDASGTVYFKTIYPGWYSGRTTHIHLRARLYDSSGNVTYNYVTQLFFDETITAGVYAKSPYSSKGTKDTSNAKDSIYNTGAAVMINLTGDTASGYAGDVNIGFSNLPSSATGNTFSVATVTSGTTAVPTLTSTIKVNSADIGNTGSVYVAALVGSTWYFNNNSSWLATPVNDSTKFPAFYSGTLSSSQSFVILSGVDLSAFKGTQLFVGYGSSAQVMLDKAQYTKVYTA